VAHTFSGGFPIGLVNANPLERNRDYTIRRIVDTSKSRKPARDIAVPIAGGYVGVVHVGLREDLVLAGVRQVQQAVAMMVGAFVLFGLVASYFFSKSVTKPLEELSEAVREVNLSGLGAPPADSPLNLAVGASPLQVETEVDRLALEFQRMVHRLAAAYHQLQETHQQLVAAEKLSAIGTIAAGMAHEMNNPLAGLQNCVRRIRRDPHNQHQLVRYLTAMEESADRMQRVVRGLLDLSRPHRPEIVEVQLEPLLERVLLVVGHKLSEAEVSPNLEVKPDAAVVWGDSQQLEQVFQNIIANACDSLRESRERDPGFWPQLDITAERQGQRIEIEIADNGAGISAESLPRLFEPFFSTKAPGSGTGLGLSIAHDIVRSHGGDIVVSSKLGRGASFRIVLPRRGRPLLEPHRES